LGTESNSHEKPWEKPITVSKVSLNS